MSEVIKNYSQAEKQVRYQILSLLKDHLGKNFKRNFFAIDYPPDGKLGDYTVACFLYAKKLKKSPVEVASELAANLVSKDLIVKITAVGPYLNFFVSPKLFGQLVLGEIARRKNKFGQTKAGQNKKIMVEFFSPNTNKPLTIGHVRNICMGQSLVNLMRFCGCKVIQSSLFNDRGIAIAKTIVGYQKWGQGQTPKSAGLKPDHFVGSFYTRFCQEAKINPNLENEAKQVLVAWEKDQKGIKEVWQKLMIWVLEGFKETLKKLKVSDFDEEYYESEYYSLGKEIVEKGLKQGVFVKNKEGVILALLEKYGLPDKIVLRPDDTSLYVTQDLYLAFLKDKHNLDQSIYVVGAEQELYFKQLFKIFELLGFSVKNNYHLSYGMIRLSSGKIKSREGLVKGTGADELIAELQDLAKAEVVKRFADLPAKELEKRSEQIALAALKFYILAVNAKTTMVFNPAESIAFTGKTGPYLQYVNARINSIFEKAESKITPRINYGLAWEAGEWDLIKMLGRFPQIVASSVAKLDPSQLANYLFDLAKTFSLFYEKSPVLKAEPEIKKARLLLLGCFKTVLVSGLGLLGLESVEKM
jgi:arginyl-tRNA synthetase